MALSKDTTFKGLAVSGAYFKVTQARATKDSLEYDVACMANAQSAGLFSETNFCDYDINGENPIQQAYEHLKTLPEFADAEDV